MPLDKIHHLLDHWQTAVHPQPSRQFGELGMSGVYHPIVVGVLIKLSKQRRVVLDIDALMES